MPPGSGQGVCVETADTYLTKSSSAHRWTTAGVPLIRKRQRGFSFPLNEQRKKRLTSLDAPSAFNSTLLNGSDITGGTKGTDTEHFSVGGESCEMSCMDVLNFLGECVIYSEIDSVKEPNA